MSERLSRMLDAIAAGRRPRRGRLDPDEARMLATAASLRAARDDGAAPSAEFVDDLERRLRHAAEQQTLSPHGQQRRRLIAAAGLAGAAAVTGVAGDRLVAALQPREPKPAPTGPLVPENASWQRVAALSDVPDGGVLGFDRSGVTGYIVRSGDSVSAISAICTHMGCRLRADATAKLLRCPCHEAAFALDGTPASSGYEYTLPPLPHLSARVSGEDVEILLPAG